MVSAPRIARLLAGALIVAALVGSSLALWSYVRGNGVGAGALALASVPVALGLALAALAGARRRALALAALALALYDAPFVAARLGSRAPGPAPFAYCDEGACGARPPLPARVVREREAAMAGLYLSSMMGAIEGDELARLHRVFAGAYDALDASPAFAGAPNALLLWSGRDHVRTLRWVPSGVTKAPAIVFLHGFGGSLTTYLEALARSELGAHAVLLAPALDPFGRWWEGEGPDVVRRLVELHLPPEADPERLYLMGVSNGAIGAAFLALDPALFARFRGTVLLSGYGEYGGPGGRYLAITGASDPRFPLSGANAWASASRSRGADVRLRVLEGDHFIALTQAPEVGREVWSWLNQPAEGAPDRREP